MVKNDRTICSLVHGIHVLDSCCHLLLVVATQMRVFFRFTNVIYTLVLETSWKEVISNLAINHNINLFYSTFKRSLKSEENKNSKKEKMVDERIKMRKKMLPN